MGKNNCWMCDRKKYEYLDHKSKNPKINKIKKLIDENDNYYAVVPHTYLTEGHILIVLKKQGKEHIKGLEEAVKSYDEEEKKYYFEKLNEPIRKWTEILKDTYNYRSVFLTCLCDRNAHFHYHLIPVKEKEKPFPGRGHTWLGVREIESYFFRKPFDELSDEKEKEKRAKEIKKIVGALEEKKRKWEIKNKKSNKK